LSDDAKMLALYLMTCSHNTIAGVFRLPDGYVAEDLKWNVERVAKGFGELLVNGFANRCESTKWVWIRKHLEWNAPENPNQWKAAAKVVRQVPDECSWRADFLTSAPDELGGPEQFGNGCTTVSEPKNNSPVPVVVPVKGGAGGKRKASETALPPDFQISDRVLKWAAEKGHAGVIDLHLEAFISTCRAKGYTYADWDEAFMNAVRKNWAGIKAPQGRQGNGVVL
jgi:hypothetical protein